MSGYPVVPPSEIEGVGVSLEIADLTTTIEMRATFPSTMTVEVL